MTKIWQNILCHCPKYIDCDIPIIYIYNNPITSFSSMKRRNKGIWDTNQRKLSNNNNTHLSDENLLNLMIKQFHNWTDIKRDNVLIIKSDELFKDEIVNKLDTFLNTTLKHFPIKYVKTKTELNKEDIELFEKYKDEIDTINEKDKDKDKIDKDKDKIEKAEIN